MRSDRTYLEHEDQITAFCDWMERANSHHSLASYDPGILHEIFSTTLYNPRVPNLRNECNCNNMLCVLTHKMDMHAFWDMPATTIRSSSMTVLLGPWRIDIEGEKDHVTGEQEPVYLSHLIRRIHCELHKPMEIFDLDIKRIPAHSIGLFYEYRRMLRQTDAYWRQRVGPHSSASYRGYERIDFLERYTIGNTDRVMTLKLAFPIPGRLCVALV
ncbi:uncharacterized protein FOMMEDRAFT_154257 [Fomitiporia mediterranea MF3/22]|uniref:uncharacterized protein n=1 Tax=Fomitiporia mediterranea (strain MF3/22) TaxID=694068 RepID=UPI00044075E7|nr:uncharacterized protein FOMMEDRAFT_154257 [Fomitiporia mediterranea MF3/22]EJD05081.1 hypothetical protein FOMMEDRAFT_154257 [Fomitiporia mediterranea MF3/22]